MPASDCSRELGVAIERSVADALAGAFAIGLRVGLAFARDCGAHGGEIRIGVLGLRNVAERFLGFGHLLERDHVLLLLGDTRRDQLLGLAGGIGQRVVEACARWWPGRSRALNQVYRLV